jgi:hypothetical protein
MPCCWLQAQMVTDRVDGAQQWWRYTGFADGFPEEDALSIQLALPAYQHAIACVSCGKACCLLRMVSCWPIGVGLRDTSRKFF